MFGLFEAFSARVGDQTREFEAAVARVASRRLATSCDPAAMMPVATPEPSGMEPARAEVIPPTLLAERRSPVTSLRASKATQPNRAKQALNFA